MMTEKAMPIDSSIFRAYDIRGIVGETLTEQSVYAIGSALGTMALEMGEKCLAVGRDGRLSGSYLSKALTEGILSTGCDVLNIGMVPTPLLYYATFVSNAHSGVMLTGSHNPAEYNGLKMVLARKTLTEHQIKKLYDYVTEGKCLQGQGKLSQLEIVEHYIKRVSEDIPLKKPLHIVVDCGNGVAGSIAPALYRAMGCKVKELFCEIDGNFPNHHPDPSQTENLHDIITAVKEHHADLGLAFDGDGDRLGVVTNKGEVIWPDRQLMLFAKSIISRKPKAKIIYDVKCSSHLATMIEALGGQSIMWKTGHSFIKSKLMEEQAELAGEMSGHLFFKDGWYGFDDALYAGARLLQILASDHRSVSDIFNDIPNSVNTPELKIDVKENEKFLLMQALMEQANFNEAEKITIDGLRVNFSDGWGLVRSSNTTPCLVLRFEAESKKALVRIQESFRALLLSIKSDLVLPF